MDHRSSPAAGATYTAAWPAAAEAGLLLTYLGMQVHTAAHPPFALLHDDRVVAATPTTVAEDWTSSGALELTGRANGPALHPVGRPATVARAATLALQLITGTETDGAALLTERARLMRLTRSGTTSCGSGTRLLRCRDTWCAINLARDADLVPALVGREPGEDPWTAVAGWAGGTSSDEVVARGRLLGMAVAALGEVRAPRQPWRITTGPSRPTRSRKRPLVVNLGALWAGPLAARLLSRSGAEVVHVESSTRRDPTRESTPDFYALLRSDAEVRVLDFADTTRLRRLLADADIVIEASRPRALQRLGCTVQQVRAEGGPRVWLRITGHRDPVRVAFGDDAAVAGGLVAHDTAGPVFAGDAIADPLSGILGALATTFLLRDPRESTIEVHLSEVAAYCAAPATEAGKHPGGTDT